MKIFPPFDPIADTIMIAAILAISISAYFVTAPKKEEMDHVSGEWGEDIIGH